MRTINKRSKKAKEIIKNSKKCIMYNLDNGFTGEEVDKKYAEETLNKFNFAKLRERTVDGKKTYYVHVHSNLWYDLIL